MCTLKAWRLSPREHLDLAVTCVCARDPAQCGKRTPAANLATCAGKLICLVLVGAIVGLLVTITMLRIDGSKGEPDEREGRRMLEAVLELVEARR